MIRTIATWGMYMEGSKEVGAGIQPVTISGSEKSNGGNPRDGSRKSLLHGRGRGCEDTHRQERLNQARLVATSVEVECRRTGSYQP